MQHHDTRQLDQGVMALGGERKRRVEAWECPQLWDYSADVKIASNKLCTVRCVEWSHVLREVLLLFDRVPGRLWLVSKGKEGRVTERSQCQLRFLGAHIGT